MKMTADDIRYTIPNRLASYVRLVTLPTPEKPSVSMSSTRTGGPPFGGVSTTGSLAIQTPPVCDWIPLPVSKRFSCSPRKKARPRMELFPVRVGPTAAMMEKG